MTDQAAGDFLDKKEREQDPWTWAAARLTPWRKPQKDDYDFRSWMKGASEDLLNAGCLYEYARESRKFRCMLVIDRTPKEERFWSAGCPDHPSPPLVEYKGSSFRKHDLSELDRFKRSWDTRGAIFLFKSGWETWLRGFADELIANRSFAELHRTSRAKVEKSLKGVLTYSLYPKAVESPGQYNIVPDRKIGLRKLGLQEVVIDWRHYNNKEIAAEIARQRPETEPEPDRRGREPQNKARLKELSVMRIRKLKRKPWERLMLVGKVCGYESCVYESPPITSEARAQMSRARQCALSYFKFVFPFLGEIPENY